VGTQEPWHGRYYGQLVHRSAGCYICWIVEDGSGRMGGWSRVTNLEALWNL